jgi:hypothetical protein
MAPTFSASAVRLRAASVLDFAGNSGFAAGGILLWNRTRRVRNPMTGRTESRPRTEEETVQVQAPQLQIVGDELAARVIARMGVTTRR